MLLGNIYSSFILNHKITVLNCYFPDSSHSNCKLRTQLLHRLTKNVVPSSSQFLLTSTGCSSILVVHKSGHNPFTHRGAWSKSYTINIDDRTSLKAERAQVNEIPISLEFVSFHLIFNTCFKCA